MSRTFGITFAAAVVVIGILIWYGFAATSGNHLAPTGMIGKVRVQKVDDDVTLVVIDFSVKNSSDRNMIVHSVEAGVATNDGTAAGSPVAARDLIAAFAAYPMLGDLYNPVLKDRDVIPAHQVLDRMVGIRFDLPVDKVENRRKLTLRVEDVTGAALELAK